MRLFARDAIKLDANENPYPPLGAGALAAERQPLSRAAAGAPRRRRWRRSTASAPTNLVVTRGADDAIDMLIRTFCRAGRGRDLDLPADLLGLRPFRAAPGRAGDRGAARREFRLRRRRLHRRRARRAEPQARLPLLAQQPDRQSRRARRRPADRRCAARDDRRRSTKPISNSPMSPSLAARSSAAAESGRASHPLQGVWPRRRAGRLRDRQRRADRSGRARAAALSACRASSIAAALPRSVARRGGRSTPNGSRGSRPTASGSRALLASVAERAARSAPAAPISCSSKSPIPKRLPRSCDGAGVRVRFRPNAAPGGVRRDASAPRPRMTRCSPPSASPRNGAGSRRAELVRETKETAIAVAVDLDRAAPRKIDTGIAFFDHMLDQVATHGGFCAAARLRGRSRDRRASQHRGLRARASARRLSKALGDKRGIGRFGFTLPMDEAEAQVLIDLSRPALQPVRGQLRGEPYRRLSDRDGAAFLPLLRRQRSARRSTSASTGENDHHKTEACFKAFGRALRQAIRARRRRDAPEHQGRAVKRRHRRPRLRQYRLDRGRLRAARRRRRC